MPGPRHTVVETPSYLGDAADVGMTDAEREGAVDQLALDPTQGDDVRGSGGVRKVRVAGRGKGKSGGYRVMAAYVGDDAPVYLLAVLSKGERATFSKAEIARMKDYTVGIKRERRARGLGMAKLFDRVVAGLGEAFDHAKGREVAGMVVHVPDNIDVAAVRERSGFSQPVFAARIGVAVATLRNWEQKRREPEGPARVLLAMLDRNPRIVEETLTIDPKRLKADQPRPPMTRRAVADGEVVGGSGSDRPARSGRQVPPHTS